jgi:hypothetical protein
MIVDTSKLIVFALVAAAAFGVQMYRDNMSQANLRLNAENGLLVGMLAILFLMVYDNISTIVEGIENTDTTSAMPLSDDTTSAMPLSDDTTSAMPPSTDTTSAMPSYDDTTSTSLATSPTTQQVVNDSTMTTQTMNSPVVSTTMESSMTSSTAPQATPTDILKAPMTISPTGQPSTIQDTEINRSMNDSSNVMSAVEAKPMVANSSSVNEPSIKVKVESEDSDEEDIEVDVSVKSDMRDLQKNVKGQLNKLVDDKNKDEGHKYVLSDPAHWVNENQYKVNILSKCQVCPVVMCDQNFMSV